MWLVHLCCVVASFLVNMLFLKIKSGLFIIRLFFPTNNISRHKTPTWSRRDDWDDVPPYPILNCNRRRRQCPVLTATMAVAMCRWQRSHVLDQLNIRRRLGSMSTTVVPWIDDDDSGLELEACRRPRGEVDQFERRGGDSQIECGAGVGAWPSGPDAGRVGG
jgi:hypothetical protein